MIGNQYKCAYLWAPKVTPRDSRGTQNWQKSANMGAVQKKKMQRTGKSILQMFARLHFLTQIFAHSCIS